MPDSIEIVINKAPQNVAAGTTVAVAMMAAGAATRRSVKGEPRAPVCGMGICMECRVTIDGRQHVRSCQVVCQEGMEIETDG
ncbi:MAG: 2Fe-2S iron-sulfur cluster-binding protein [Acidobacteriota bacterium]